MRLDVFQQSLREARRSVYIWAPTAAGAVWISLLAYPLFRLLFGSGPAAWLSALAAVDGSQVSLDNWSRAITLGIVLPVMLVIYAVSQGSELVAGEEERGSLGLLLSTPLKRYHLILQKVAVLFLLVLACSLAAWLALSIVSLVGIIQLSILQISGDVLALYLLGLAFGILALALGSLTGRRIFSRSIVLAYALLVFFDSRLVSGFPAQIQVRWLSPFYYYVLALLGTNYWTNILFLLALTAVGLVLAWMFFEHRDLPV